MADDAAFGSRQAAEHYLARTLPEATASNPKYLTKSDGSTTVWLTKSLRVEGGRVAMDEAFTQTKTGVSTSGTHRAAFALGDVDITPMTSADDAAPNGDAANGILFTCAKPGCVAARWDGQARASDKTDIYVQDIATRDAFSPRSNS